MWIPIFSATILQALFGNQLFGAPSVEPGPAADYARRAGCRLGPNGEWIAEVELSAAQPLRSRAGHTATDVPKVQIDEAEPRRATRTFKKAPGASWR